MEFELDDIRKIVELMNENELTAFELEKEGCRLCLKKGGAYAAVLHPSQIAGAAPPPPPAAAAPEPEANANLKEIKAPFIGTFYRAPSPDAEPYVQTGQEVGPDTVLCIIEAMKVMNEIKAEMRGKIREILVENGHAVQFGQPIFRIEAH